MSQDDTAKSEAKCLVAGVALEIQLPRQAGPYVLFLKDGSEQPRRSWWIFMMDIYGGYLWFTSIYIYDGYISMMEKCDVFQWWGPHIWKMMETRLDGMP